jgi:membrane fusion protein, copper/silver efflux system
MRSRRIVVMLPVLFGIAAALVAGCAHRETKTTARSGQSVGVFWVSIENRPARPAVGNNLLVIAVSDSSGRTVQGAEVSATIVMQAMGTMPRMESGGEVRETRAGIYEAKYGLAMAGEWDLDLTIRSREGAEARATYRLSTSTKEILFASGTPPPGRAGLRGATQGRPGDGAVDVGPGVVVLDAQRRQEIGVRTARVEKRPLVTTIRAAGKVAYDETRRAEISLKFSGWVRTIRVNYTGQIVRRGEPLFTVYSPELFSAEQEYLEAMKPAAGGASGRDPELAQAARQRLLLWDIPAAQIDAIARTGKPIEAIPIVAPVSGVVVEKNVVQGSSFTAGQTLYRIAPMNPVWVLASVYQYELPLIRTGMGALIQTPFLGEASRRGRVSYVNPYLDPSTRTGEVRVEVPNPRGDLKPGMFVDVVLERDLGTRLAIPESAVLYAGDRRVVFVDLGDGRLAPRDVNLGAKAGDTYEVLAGLKEGEVVVTSGNFLIAAESRIQSSATGF